MIDTPPAPLDTDDHARDAAAERVARQTRILTELAEIGLRLAHTLLRQAEAQPAATQTPAAADGPAGVAVRGDLGLTFDRLTRAVRLTLLLETRIAEGEAGRLAQAAEARAKAKQAREKAELDAWAEAQADAVLAVVEHTLEADGQDDETIIARVSEARDHLESGDADYDVFEAPVGLVIARICKIFGVEPDWSDWAETDWAIEEAQDRPRGSPYARDGFDGGGADGPPPKDANVNNDTSDVDRTEPASGSP